MLKTTSVSYIQSPPPAMAYSSSQSSSSSDDEPGYYFALAGVKGEIHLVQISLSTPPSAMTLIDIKLFKHELATIFPARSDDYNASQGCARHPTDRGRLGAVRRGQRNSLPGKGNRGTNEEVQYGGHQNSIRGEKAEPIPPPYAVRVWVVLLAIEENESEWQSVAEVRWSVNGDAISFLWGSSGGISGVWVGEFHMCRRLHFHERVSRD
ncbi:hypothetical protein F5887DRAFT_435216 [Amanita rubescens]|nr:hypothetical protein F5887DRAFT_435216 [Amanita rubescens]